MSLLTVTGYDRDGTVYLCGLLQPATAANAVALSWARLYSVRTSLKATKTNLAPRCGPFSYLRVTTAGSASDCVGGGVVWPHPYMIRVRTRLLQSATAANDVALSWARV